jgi:transmembrane sensor
MSEVVKLRTRVEIDEEAAAWAWRMDSATVTPADRLAYEAWLRQDPRNGRAAREMSQVWRALDGLAEAKHSEKIATFSAAAAQAGARRRWWFAAAAVLAAIAVGVAWLQRGSEVQVLATAVGQQRSVTLADGSVISLNTNTIVEADLQRRAREIFLRKGEAHFQVAHDAARPFFVHAGDAVVRAVGTGFEVRVLTDQHVDIVVDEGRVEVRPAAMTAPARNDGTARPPAAVRAISAGQRLSTASRDLAVTPISDQQLSSELAWREGAVVFDGERLADAVTEIERYTDARITISDPAVAALRVGGRFRTGDLQEFFDALQAALPVSVRRTPGGVVIKPRTQPPTPR